MTKENDQSVKIVNAKAKKINKDLVKKTKEINDKLDIILEAIYKKYVKITD